MRGDGLEGLAAPADHLQLGQVCGRTSEADVVGPKFAVGPESAVVGFVKAAWGRRAAAAAASVLYVGVTTLGISQMRLEVSECSN